MEAAPRFELGIKDLQSSALPLGYAAFLKGIKRIMAPITNFILLKNQLDVKKVVTTCRCSVIMSPARL